MGAVRYVVKTRLLCIGGMCDAVVYGQISDDGIFVNDLDLLYKKRMLYPHLGGSCWIMLDPQISP